MNTTAAAIEANVTAATIRTWCRNGVITATKAAGKWVIDQVSLAARIAIGQLKTRKAPKPVVYSVETMKAIGGNEWIRGDKHRVYLNDWLEFAEGIDIDFYKSGGVWGAAIDGQGIANGRARQILGAVHKVYFDATDGKLYVQHTDADCFEIRYLDGHRDDINIVARIFAGVRAAIAAL